MSLLLARMENGESGSVRSRDWSHGRGISYHSGAWPGSSRGPPVDHSPTAVWADVCVEQLAWLIQVPNEGVQDPKLGVSLTHIRLWWNDWRVFK